MSDEDFLPGTKRLYDKQGFALSHHTELKKHGNIVLVPQSTGHLDDPLHWSLQRKPWHALTLLLITALTGATTNHSGSVQFQENDELGSTTHHSMLALVHYSLELDIGRS
jgi:hypothetical protein